MEFLYISNELSERETRKKIPFTVTTTTIKYPGINLTREVKGLYSENQRTLKKETEEDTSRRIYYVHRLKELTSLKCSYHPKQSIDSTQSVLKHQRCISQI